MRLLFLILSTVFGSRGQSRATGRETDKLWSDEERDHHRFERRLAALNSVIGVIGSIATAAAAAFAYKAYLEAKRQANVAQRALEVSLRPWVYIEKLDLSRPISIINGKLELTTQATVKNYSQLPANGIMLSTEVVAYGEEFNNSHSEVKEFCRKQRKVNFHFGNILPAGDAAISNFANGSIDLNKSPLIFQNAARERLIKLAIKGCLNYNGPDGVVHQVNVLYQLFDTENFYIKVQDGLISQANIQLYLLFMYEDDSLQTN